MLSTWKVNSQGGTAGDHSPGRVGAGLRWWQGQLAVVATVWQEWKVHQGFHPQQCTCCHSFQHEGILKSSEEKKRARKEIQRIPFSFLSYMPLKREVSDTQCKQVRMARIKKTTHSFIFGLSCAACRILVPRSGTKPLPPAMEAQSPNHCTAREAPLTQFQHSFFHPLRRARPTELANYW